MTKAPAPEIPVPFKFKVTLAVGVMPFRSSTVPLLTFTPEVFVVPLPNAPATPIFRVLLVMFVAPE